MSKLSVEENDILGISEKDLDKLKKTAEEIYGSPSTVEDVLRAEEDVKDAEEALDQARQETVKAIEWEKKCFNRLQEYKLIRVNLKNNA